MVHVKKFKVYSLWKTLQHFFKTNNEPHRGKYLPTQPSRIYIQQVFFITKDLD